LASEAAQNAYSPYSKFKVGACVLYEDGKIYAGCNVENASYGLTLCAERTAISSAIADGQKSKLVAVAIYSPNAKLCYPCGACRQWIAEFAKDASVIIENSEGNPQTFSIKELLPYSFEL
jgi:cytidine deaminase